MRTEITITDALGERDVEAVVVVDWFRPGEPGGGDDAEGYPYPPGPDEIEGHLEDVHDDMDELLRQAVRTPEEA